MSIKHFFEEQAVRNASLQHELRQAFDPFGMVSIAFKAQQAWLLNPDALVSVMGRYANDMARWQQFTSDRFLGLPDTDVFPGCPLRNPRADRSRAQP